MNLYGSNKCIHSFIDQLSLQHDFSLQIDAFGRLGSFLRRVLAIYPTSNQMEFPVNSSAIQSLLRMRILGSE